MPNNITDVDTFTDPIQAPADGDALNATTLDLAPQGLANRTRHNKNRLDAGAEYFVGQITGTSVAILGTWTLTTVSKSSGFSLASNQVTVPEDGLYEVSIAFYGTTTSASNPSNHAIALYDGASDLVVGLGFRYSTDTGASFPAHAPSKIVPLAVASPVYLRNNNTTATETGSVNTSYITIRRVGV